MSRETTGPPPPREVRCLWCGRMVGEYILLWRREPAPDGSIATCTREDCSGRLDDLLRRLAADRDVGAPLPDGSTLRLQDIAACVIREAPSRWPASSAAAARVQAARDRAAPAIRQGMLF